MSVHKPKSAGSNLLVTMIMNIVPVTTPIKVTANAIKPEYVTRILLNSHTHPIKDKIKMTCII